MVRQAVVNRLWAWLLGRGIIHEPDDIRDDNPPRYPELLAYLEKEFVASGYNTKSVLRLILNSRTYQSSSVLRNRNPKAEADFARYPLRRLDAEVLIDAINKVTGTTDLYTSAIPEPFTYIPARHARHCHRRRQHHQPLSGLVRPVGAGHGPGERAVGQVASRPVAAHAEFQPHPEQARIGHVDEDLDRPGDRPLKEIINELYLTILSRYPTAGRDASIMEYLFLYRRRDASDRGRQVRPGRPARAQCGAKTRQFDRHRLGPDQQHRISLSALALALGTAWSSQNRTA